jgi:hypothetical protein
MGSNKTFQQKHGRRVVLGESTEYRALRHAIEKAHGDRKRAIRNVCRLYGVSKLDALPGAIRAAALALLDAEGPPSIGDVPIGTSALGCWPPERVVG